MDKKRDLRENAVKMPQITISILKTLIVLLLLQLIVCDTDGRSLLYHVAALFHYSTWIAIVEEISQHKFLYFGNVCCLLFVIWVARRINRHGRPRPGTEPTDYPCLASKTWQHISVRKPISHENKSVVIDAYVSYQLERDEKRMDTQGSAKDFFILHNKPPPPWPYGREHPERSEARSSMEVDHQEPVDEKDPSCVSISASRSEISSTRSWNAARSSIDISRFESCYVDRNFGIEKVSLEDDTLLSNLTNVSSPSTSSGVTSDSLSANSSLYSDDISYNDSIAAEGEEHKMVRTSRGDVTEDNSVCAADNIMGMTITPDMMLEGTAPSVSGISSSCPLSSAEGFERMSDTSEVRQSDIDESMRSDSVVPCSNQVQECLDDMSSASDDSWDLNVVHDALTVDDSCGTQPNESWDTSSSSSDNSSDIEVTSDHLVFDQHPSVNENLIKFLGTKLAGSTVILNGGHKPNESWDTSSSSSDNSSDIDVTSDHLVFDQHPSVSDNLIKFLGTKLAGSTVILNDGHKPDESLMATKTKVILAGGVLGIGGYICWRLLNK